jgi:hypothetical protein
MQADLDIVPKKPPMIIFIFMPFILKTGRKNREKQRQYKYFLPNLLNWARPVVFIQHSGLRMTRGRENSRRFPENPGLFP